MIHIKALAGAGVAATAMAAAVTPEAPGLAFSLNLFAWSACGAFCALWLFKPDPFVAPAQASLWRVAMARLLWLGGLGITVLVLALLAAAALDFGAHLNDRLAHAPPVSAAVIAGFLIKPLLPRIVRVLDRRVASYFGGAGE